VYVVSEQFSLGGQNNAFGYKRLKVVEKCSKIALLSPDDVLFLLESRC